MSATAISLTAAMQAAPAVWACAAAASWSYARTFRIVISRRLHHRGVNVRRSTNPLVLIALCCKLCSGKGALDSNSDAIRPEHPTCSGL